MKHVFTLVMAAAVAVCLSACGGKKDKPNTDAPVNLRMSQEMKRSAADTADVLNLTRRFLDTLKDNDIDGALTQLYELKDGSMYPLSDKRAAEIRRNMEDFPVLSYKIDKLLMYSDTDTEVRYTIEFFEKPEGSTQPNTLKCSVNPVRVSGQWYLTIAEQTREGNSSNN